MISWRQVSVFGDEAARDLEDQLHCMATHGIGALELRGAWGKSVVDFDASDIRRARGAIAGAGVRVSAIGSPIGKAAIGQDVRIAEEQLRHAMNTAAELGTRLVRVFSYYVDTNQHSREREQVISQMSQLAEVADDAGMVLVHENERGIYGDTPERCRDLIDAVSSPALRSCFDPANFIQAGCEDVIAAWDMLEPEVVHVHVKDARLADGVVAPAGSGDGRWPDLIDRMSAGGYAGYLTIEPHLGIEPDLHGGTVEGDGCARLGVAADALRRLLVEPAQQ